MRVRLCLCAMICLCVGCTDFFNRSFRRGDWIPAQPWAMQLQSGKKVEGLSRLETSIKIENRSIKPEILKSEQFWLRLPDGSQLPSDPLAPISFEPGESKLITASFTLTAEQLQGDLFLILDKTKQTKREQLTLIHLDLNKTTR